MSTVRAFVVSIIILVTALGAGLADEPKTAAPGVAARPEITPALMDEQPEEAVLQIIVARSLPSALTPKDLKRLERVAKELQKGNVKKAKKLWATAVEEISQAAAPIDMDAILHWVLREAYIDANASLRAPANKVRYYEDMRSIVREHVEASRETLTTMRRDTKVEIRTISIRSKYKKKREPVRERGDKKMSDHELAEYIRVWEDQLAGIGQDAALASIDLQEALQKQQQLVQTMSNVSKLLHDTAMAVIRKIG